MPKQKQIRVDLEASECLNQLSDSPSNSPEWIILAPKNPEENMYGIVQIILPVKEFNKLKNRG